MKTTNNIIINSVMKNIVKHMRAFLIITGISISSAAWCSITFDPTSDVGDAATSVSKGGVTISVPVGAGTFNNGSEYRWNSSPSNKLTVSCSTKIVRIVFTAASTYSTSEWTVSSGGGTWTAASGTWTNASGSTSVQFLNNSHKTWLSSIEVTLETTGCDLKVWNGSSYITWQNISSDDPLPVAPPVAGYDYWRYGTELCVWCTEQIPTSPCRTYITDEDNYRWAVTDPYLPKHYPNGATTLYAVYVADGSSCQTTTAPYANNFWTVTFKANGGTGDDYTQQVVKSTATALLANRFERTGYDFAGWATSSGGSVVYANKGKITATANTTLWAKWTPKVYTIMTDVSGCGGGSCTATIAGEEIIERAYGTTGLALVATPSSGYYFAGWTKDPNNSTGGTIANAGSASTTYNVGTDDATLTATFRQYLHVTYNANGGSSAPTDATNYEYNAYVSISNSIPTNSGYTFIGWATSSSRANAGTVDYTRNQSNAFRITADQTLYAVWCKTITGAALTVSGTTPSFNYSTGKGSTTFSWGSVTGATAYELVVRNTTDGVDVHTSAVSASSNYAFTEMVPGKTYRATVTASNTCTNTSGYVDESIACPSIAWPGEASDIVVSTPGKNSATVTFTIPNATSFEVWLSDGTAGGAEVVGSRSTISANSSGVASKEFTGLTNDHTYYIHAIGKNICNNVTAEKQDVSFNTAHQEVYDTYLFSCVTFGATVPSGKAYVTSGNGKTILAKHPVHLTITGAVANHYVQIEPSEATISVYFVKDDKYQVVNPSNQLRIGNDGTFAKDIYFAYTPSEAGDGSVTVPTFTVRCDGFEQTFNADGSLLKVRAMPENYAIINKVGNSWYILPADMGDANGTQPAVAVRVDNNDNPTTAYTEAADNAFRIWPIDVSGANRFRSTAAGENGSIIRMSMPNNLYSGNALAFGASASSTAIGAFNHATLTSSDATVGSHSYWDITTTENVVGGNTYFKYELYNPARGSGNKLVISSKKWGTYSGITQETRFVKIEETKDAELTIMEWGQASLVVRYSGSGTIALTGVSVDNTAVGTANMTRIGTSDLYKIEGLSTMQANPSKLIVISVDETVAAVTTGKESAFTIPFIISNEQIKNNTELRNLMVGSTADEKKAIAKTVDVVVCSGGEFDTNSGADSFSDLYIYPGGKVNLGHNIGLQNIYLRGGFSWLNANFALPQMKVTDGISISGLGNSGNGVYYDLYLDNVMYYTMALPKDVALNSVTNEENGADWNAWVKGYTGKNRTLEGKPSGWIYAWNISPGTHLYRGKGYEIAIKPRLGRPYGILRFPLLSSAAWSNETECNPEVVAWGITDGQLNAGITANNAGWNFMGNPFFSSYNNTVGEESIIIADSLAKQLDGSGNWTGKYEWVGQRVKFFTIPKYTDEDYFDVRATPYKLDAFYPFFVQVNSGTEASPASLTFGTGNRALKLPRRYSVKAQQREVAIDFSLTDEFNNSDVAGLDISDIYSAAFDEDDKEKTILSATQYLKIYTIASEYLVAFNALPEVKAAQPIPVGIITPEAGNYTIALTDGLDVTEVEHVWLTDYEKGTQTDLLEEDYHFYNAAGQLNDRFAITVLLKSDNMGQVTGIDDVEIDADVEQPIKFLYRDQIYIMLRGVVYDMTGRQVREINK